MKTRYLMLLFVVISLLTSGCNSSVKHDDETVKIRIENASAFDMDSLLVGFPKEEVFYGNISSGNISTYESVTEAYGYAYIETKINGELSVLQPIDYMGESLLKPGSYTYILDVQDYETNEDSTSPNYNLSLELRED